MMVIVLYLLFGALLRLHAWIVFMTYDRMYVSPEPLVWLSGVFMWIFAWPVMTLVAYHKAVVAIAKGEMEL